VWNDGNWQFGRQSKDVSPQNEATVIKSDGRIVAKMQRQIRAWHCLGADERSSNRDRNVIDLSPASGRKAYEHNHNREAFCRHLSSWSVEG
jgi:hypothetical protein